MSTYYIYRIQIELNRLINIIKSFLYSFYNVVFLSQIYVYQEMGQGIQKNWIDLILTAIKVVPNNEDHIYHKDVRNVIFEAYNCKCSNDIQMYALGFYIKRIIFYFNWFQRFCY